MLLHGTSHMAIATALFLLRARGRHTLARHPTFAQCGPAFSRMQVPTLAEAVVGEAGAAAEG